MSYTDEQVLQIVDNCFHMYASSYRNDAKEEAIDIMAGMNKPAKPANGDDKSDEECTLPVVSQQRELLAAFLQYLDENNKAAWITHDGIIGQFLAANCG